MHSYLLLIQFWLGLVVEWWIGGLADWWNRFVECETLLSSLQVDCLLEFHNVVGVAE